MSTDNNNTDRENKVLALYNEGKTTRDIAKELRMSLRDINTILKKAGLSHGIVTVQKNIKSSNNNEKATEAYKAILRRKDAIRSSNRIGS